MKKFLSLLFVLLTIKSFSQPIVYRSNSSVTVLDYNFFAGNSFRLPVYMDTTQANSAITLDSCGKMIYTYKSNKLYYRGCGPRRWLEVTNGAVVTNAIDSLKLANDSVYGKKNGLFIFQYKNNYIKPTDTAAMLSPYLLKIDTASLSNRINTKIDSLIYSGDSVYARINGSYVFQYLDSSSLLGLQNVLDNNSSLTKNNTIQTQGYKFIINNESNLSGAKRSFLGIDTTVSALYVGNNVDSFSSAYFYKNNLSLSVKEGAKDAYFKIKPDSIIVIVGSPQNLISIDSSNLYINKTVILDNIQNGGAADSVLVIDTNGVVKKVVQTTSSGIPNGTATGTDTYSATVSGVSSYTNGAAYIIKFTNGNTTTSTLNINGLGALTLYRNNDGQIIGGDIQAGAEMLIIYDSTSPARFQCIGISPNSLFAYVTNGDTTAITKGMPVYAYSGVGDRMVVKRAYNKADSTSAQTVGLVYSSSIGVNQKGLIMVQGQLDNLSILPTSTYADGDAIYLDSIPGGITKTKPSAPYHLVYLGVVTTANNGNAGRMYVRVQNGYEFGELHDVAISSPQNNQVIAYSDTQKLWKNRNIYSIVDTTNTISTKYTADTMRTNIYATLNGKVKYTDTASMLTNYQRMTAFPIATFGAGSGAAGDTSAFTTSALYGSFYNAGSDTIVITSYTAVCQGTSPSVTPTIYFNDSLNATGGATKIVNSPSAVTSITTGNTVTSLNNTSIPPGNFVWVTTGTVTTKPTYFSLTLIGYRKR